MGQDLRISNVRIRVEISNGVRQSGPFLNILFFFSPLLLFSPLFFLRVDMKQTQSNSTEYESICKVIAD